MEKLETKLLSGNKAVGEAVELSRVEGIFAYPITPQTTIVEDLSERVASGRLKAKYIPVDAEASAMASTFGAEKAGIRAFTATSSQGLLHMMEPLSWVAYGRCSLVMVNVDRALCHPWGLWTDTNASMAVKDQGWITFYCEDAQDILDSVIMSYRISEQLLIPVMVSYDGFRCSHAYEGVSVPTQAMIDKFLPPWKPVYVMDPKKPYSYGNLASSDHYARLRFRHHRDILLASKLARSAAQEYRLATGLTREMVLEKYQTRGADTIFVAAGSKVGPIREVVKNDSRLGLVKIKMFRPWPEEEILRAVCGAKRVIVVDDNLSPGQGGHIWQALRSSACGRADMPKIFGYVYGLNGQDFKPALIQDIARDAGQRKNDHKPVLWGEKIEVRSKDGRIEFPEPAANKSDLPPDIRLSPGHTGCSGCGATLAMKLALEALGDDIAMVIPACCWTILQGANGQSSLPRVPVLHTA